MGDVASDRQDGLAVVGIFLGLLALLGMVFSVGLAVRATDDAKRVGTVATSAGRAVEVALSEFTIDPAMPSVAVGGALKVTNKGSVAHNLAVQGTDLKTPDVAAGASVTLDVSSLAVGEYTIICAVPGHEGSGMTGMLHIVEGAGGSAAATPPTSAMSAEAMDEAMAARTKAFPAKTSGVGGQDMAPKVLADGTKEFDLTASEFDWEVEPGKVVKAWGYNEQVPGPTIRVGVGDHVKIVLENELPESTVIHPHGMLVPNAMDGVPDITQAPIKPGESFTYEFTTREPMVAMYHSHHDAAKQVTNGLLGALYVGAMPLPAGTPTPTVDMPMVLNDAGAIGYSLNGKSFPATAPIVAKQGDWIKVDYMNEGLQIHPMHLHGMPQLVIAKDGYPQTPHLEDTVLVAPGERVSVLVHATEVGTWAWHCHILTHAEREDGMFGMVTALVVQ
ncbi:MAG: putative multicopper oxidase [Actinomycetia bacterium]|nr:putative multicopper oxidase [Actinomycetes bacterium]